MVKLCAVYNTCGISGKDNTDYYIEALSSLLNQDYKDMDVVLSACLNKDEHIDKLKKEFGNQFKYNIINDKLPVNITFNASVNRMVKEYGIYEGYLYLDSGVKFNDHTQISKLMELYNRNIHGMLAAQVDNDSGYSGWFGFDKLPPYNFTVPMGRTCHLHCQIFNHDILEFYGNVLPDIFASYCTESVFTFVCAAIKRLFVISKDVLVHHAFGSDDGLDGHSSGFRAPHGTWDHTFSTNKTMVDICSSYVGRLSGFGYEEIRGILLHNPNCFNENICTNDVLKWFIKDNLYLKQHEFDYNSIKSEFYA